MGKLIQGEWVTDNKLKAAEAAQYQRAGGKFERAGYHSQSDVRNPHGIVPVGFDPV